MSEIGRKVKLRRKELGMTQRDLADQMGYKNNCSISLIENGREVTSNVVIKLANALKTSPAWLMGWTEDERPLHDERMARIVSKLYELTFSELNQVERIIDTFKDNERR